MGIKEARTGARVTVPFAELADLLGMNGKEYLVRYVGADNDTRSAWFIVEGGGLPEWELGCEPVSMTRDAVRDRVAPRMPVEFYEDEDGCYRYRINGDDGRRLVTSKPYPTPSNAFAAFEDVRAVLRAFTKVKWVANV